MTATLAPPVANRIANYLPPTPVPLPATPAERQEAWANALFAAAMVYQRQLAHPDAAVAERAARALFDLEKTRLRHGRDLAGATAEDDQPSTRDLLPPLEPIPYQKATPPADEPDEEDAEEFFDEDNARENSGPAGDPLSRGRVLDFGFYREETAEPAARRPSSLAPGSAGERAGVRGNNFPRLDDGHSLPKTPSP